MIKKITLFVLFAASCFVLLPAETSARDSNAKTDSIAGLSTANLVFQQGRGRGRGNRVWYRSKRRNGTWYGYKNYGQYRRTQVGNRRYRYVRRPYYRDGRLFYRLTRIFY